jgi:DNA-directed RNA polymerase subunit RPC12/RpoP
MVKMRKSRDWEEGDVVEDDEERERREELRRLKMEREKLKLMAENEKLKQEIEKYSANPGGPSALGAITAALIKAGVKPEEASEFLSKMNPEALATLTSLTSSNPYLPVLMYILSHTRGQSPQAVTVKDIVEINKNTLDLAREISSSKGGGESGVVMVLKSLVDSVKEIYQQQLVGKLEELKNVLSGKSGLEAILEDGEKFRRFKELFGGSSANPEVQIQLEKMRQEHEFRMKQLDIELLKLKGEFLEGRRRAKMFSQTLRKLGEGIAEGLASATGEKGMGYSVEKVKCPKCGSEIPNVTLGSEVVCPKCNTRYLVRERK